MLDIKEIERRLGNGEEVRLECIDKKSFINIDHGLFIIDNASLADSSLLVVDISAVGTIRIKDCQFSITSDELKYFKIKEKSYTEKLLDRDSKFTELLSVATKAVNNGDLSSFVVNIADSSDKIGECLYIGANMTYHAIENEIKGLEMKEELEVKEDVSSECVDRDKHLNPEEKWHDSRRTIQNLYGINKDTLELNKTRRITPYSQFKRFRIVEVKEDVKTSEFDVVVDSAFKALKDGVVMEIGLNNGVLMIQNGQASVRKCISKSDVAQNGACKYIEYIDSLYAETFVIESEDHIKMVKLKASVKLTNGNEFIVDNATNEFLTPSTSFEKLTILTLKGATVTQQKGNK